MTRNNPAEIELSIQYAERQLIIDAIELGEHVQRMNWLYKRRNQLTRQIERDNGRLAAAQRSAVAES